jgi:exodeoxyribonuclease VII small subunit
MDGSEKIAQPPEAAKVPATAGHAPEDRFDEILIRLRGVVEKLEGGNLPLEDSLKFFEEGIDLCRRGASILDSAERKVEVLLSGSTGAPRTAPFDSASGDAD